MAKRDLNGRAVSHGCSPTALTPATLSPWRQLCVRVWESSAPTGLGHTRCARPVSFRSQRSSGSGSGISTSGSPSRKHSFTKPLWAHSSSQSVVCRSPRPGQRVHTQPRTVVLSYHFSLSPPSPDTGARYTSTVAHEAESPRPRCRPRPQQPRMQSWA